METVIVVVMIAAAVVFAGRSLTKSLDGRSTCTGSCSGCVGKCGQTRKV